MEFPIVTLNLFFIPYTSRLLTIIPFSSSFFLNFKAEILHLSKFNNKKFADTLFVFILFVTACLGSCYEFWLRYGASPDCIYYKSKTCDNMATMGNPPRTSIIDYMFPNSIIYYPYEKCKSNMSQEGGKKAGQSMKGGNFVSTYAERKNEDLQINLIIVCFEPTL